MAEKKISDFYIHKDKLYRNNKNKKLNDLDIINLKNTANLLKTSWDRSKETINKINESYSKSNKHYQTDKNMQQKTSKFNSNNIKIPSSDELVNIDFDLFQLTHNDLSKLNHDRENSPNKIAKHLKAAPALKGVIDSIKNNKMLIADLTPGQQEALNNGLLKLTQNNNGTLSAILRDNTGKFVKHIDLKEINLSPDKSLAISNLMVQYQMAQIMNMLENISYSIEKILQGQQDDRLALVKSARQQFINAKYLRDIDLKRIAILNAIKTCEDSRNQLMISTKRDIDEINKSPENFFKRFSTSQDKIDNTINNIYIQFKALTEVSITEIMCYNELKEYESSVVSLKYYTEYLAIEIPEEFMKTLHSKSSVVGIYNFWDKDAPKVIKTINETTRLIEENIESSYKLESNYQLNKLEDKK